MHPRADEEMQLSLKRGIEKFARTVSKQPLGLAKFAPEPWGNIRLCFENARRKASESGGHPRYGWMFQHKRVTAIPGPGYLSAIHHAVWQAPDGHLYDVTPLHPDTAHHPLAAEADTLFLVDDEAQPIQRGRILGPRPTKFFALDERVNMLVHVQQLQAREDEDCIVSYIAAERATNRHS
jgi:hypothetical protein